MNKIYWLIPVILLVSFFYFFESNNSSESGPTENSYAKNNTKDKHEVLKANVTHKKVTKTNSDEKTTIVSSISRLDESAPAIVRDDNTYEEYVAERATKKTEVKMEETYNDGSYNTSKIDSDIVANGKMVLTDINSMKSLPKGSEVVLNLFGQELNGVVEKNKIAGESGNKYIKVRLGGPGEYMNVYYGTNISRGKIYSPEGSYMFEHNGEVGFVISIYEYKKLKDALFID